MKKERDKEDKKAAKKLKKEKELKSPVEAQPPLGPLVALGKPREKATKRPRCVWRRFDMTFDLLNSSHFNRYYLLYNNAILIGFLYCFVMTLTTLRMYCIYMYIVHIQITCTNTQTYWRHCGTIYIYIHIYIYRIQYLFASWSNNRESLTSYVRFRHFILWLVMSI